MRARGLAGAPAALLRAAALAVGCVAASFGLAQIALRLLRDPALHTSVWWPLAGVGVAVLARIRPGAWPLALAALAAGQIPTYLTTYYPFPSALGGTLANCVEALVVVTLARREPGGIVLDSPGKAARFAACAAAGVALGASVFTAGHLPDLTGAQAWVLWNGYVRTHALGLLLVSPLFLVSAGRLSLLTDLRRRATNLEWLAQFTVTGLVTAGVFMSDQTLVPGFVCALPLVWGGLRLGPLRAMGSLLLMALLTTVGTLDGTGPVVQTPPAAQTLAVQILLAVATLCTLFIVLSAQQKEALLDLASNREADLAEAERIGGVGSVVWDLRTGGMRWSEGVYQQLGRDRADQPPDMDAFIAAVHPDDQAGVVASASDVLTTGQAPGIEFRLLRPDGVTRSIVTRNKTEYGPDGSAAYLRAMLLDVTAMREAEVARQRAHDKLTGVLEAVEDVAIIGSDPPANLISFFSRGAERMLGWRAQDVVGRESPLIYHSRADIERAGHDALRVLGDELLAVGRSKRRSVCRRRDGSEFVAQLSLTVIPDPAGQPATFVAVVVDLTEVLRAEAELQESEDRFRLAFEGAPLSMAIVAMDEDLDALGRIVRANPALCRFVGMEHDDLVGRRLADLMTPVHAGIATDDLRQLLSSGGDTTSNEHAFHRAGGGESWGLLSTSVVRPADGRAPYLITMIEDVTAQMQLTERLRHEAQHDPLTGLPNRQMLHGCLAEALADEDVSRGPVAVLYVDLDGFKGVNDGMGHSAGDELLVQVARRISACVRVSDVVARLGGDEFAVLLPRLGDLPAARGIAERIVQSLAEPFTLEGATCRIGASVGIALSGPPGSPGAAQDAAPDLLDAADEAMYDAKREGKGQVRVSGR
ncbi:hypothetical protein JCM9957A_56500 [Kineosporia succinea]